MEPAYLEFTLGILLCGKVRRFLELCRFRGYQIEWHESSGWITRQWIVKGPPEQIDAIRLSLRQAVERMEQR